MNNHNSIIYEVIGGPLLSVVNEYRNKYNIWFDTLEEFTKRYGADRFYYNREKLIALIFKDNPPKGWTKGRCSVPYKSNVQALKEMKELPRLQRVDQYLREIFPDLENVSGIWDIIWVEDRIFIEIPYAGELQTMEGLVKTTEAEFYYLFDRAEEDDKCLIQ